MNTKITKLFEDYKKQREISEIESAKAKKERAHLGAIEFQIVELMLEERVKSIGTEDGCNLNLRRHLGISCTEENREQVREWLVEETGDDQPFMEEVVSKKALSELVQTRIDNGAVAQDFPDFLNVNLHPGVSVLGWKQLMASKQQQE